MCCCRFEHLQETSTDRERKEKSNSAFKFSVFVSAARETVARTQTHVANKMILSPLDDVVLNREEESYVIAFIIPLSRVVCAHGWLVRRCATHSSLSHGFRRVALAFSVASRRLWSRRFVSRARLSLTPSRHVRRVCRLRWFGACMRGRAR